MIETGIYKYDELKYNCFVYLKRNYNLYLVFNSLIKMWQQEKLK